jgi:hypothetical protein
MEVFVDPKSGVLGFIRHPIRPRSSADLLKTARHPLHVVLSRGYKVTSPTVCPAHGPHSTAAWSHHERKRKVALNG